MKKVFVIIGASYGDEGKGLATDYLASQAAGDKMVTVLTNGGPQRGHTVELPDGRRHVFKHFGAATLRGAESYFGPMYMVNPMQFAREYAELTGLDRAPAAYMHPQCRFTTPYDVLVNQMQQEKRGSHNSCGYGIWETVLRYRRGEGMAFSAFLAMDREGRAGYLRRLRDGYFRKRCRECGIGPGEVWEVFHEEGLLQHYLDDCEMMRLVCPVLAEEELGRWDRVLFENAQGLLLDGNREGEEDFTTPSTTGMGRVLPMIERSFKGAEVEVCYVTRSYLTRHGDGPMEDEIGPGAEQAPAGLGRDLTNPTNRFQGALRYGMIKDIGKLADRIGKDFGICAGSRNNDYRPAVMVTHLNEYAGIDTEGLRDLYGRVYLSDGRTNRDVERL